MRASKIFFSSWNYPSVELDGIRLYLGNTLCNLKKILFEKSKSFDSQILLSIKEGWKIFLLLEILGFGEPEKQMALCFLFPEKNQLVRLFKEKWGEKNLKWSICSRDRSHVTINTWDLDSQKLPDPLRPLLNWKSLSTLDEAFPTWAAHQLSAWIGKCFHKGNTGCLYLNLINLRRSNIYKIRLKAVPKATIIVLILSIILVQTSHLPDYFLKCSLYWKIKVLFLAQKRVVPRDSQEITKIFLRLVWAITSLFQSTLSRREVFKSYDEVFSFGFMCELHQGMKMMFW